MSPSEVAFAFGLFVGTLGGVAFTMLVEWERRTRTIRADSDAIYLKNTTDFRVTGTVFAGERADADAWEQACRELGMDSEGRTIHDRRRA